MAETELDRYYEFRAAEVLRELGFDVAEIPKKFYPADYIINGVSFGEYKKRGGTSSKTFNTTYVTVEKLSSLYNLGGSSVYLFVEFDDGLFYSINPKYEKMEICGKSGRKSDSAEPVACIPIKQFRKLADAQHLEKISIALLESGIRPPTAIWTTDR